MIALLVFAVFFDAALAFAARPVVDLGYARYRGVTYAGVSQYLGLQYAAPPIANLRWRAPQDPLPTSGIQDASQYQLLCSGENRAGKPGVSEDCLYANVFTPDNATSTSKLPVFVWIQGGGFANNDNANYNGTTLVRQGPMVVVTFNYRAGAFGFLASSQIEANGSLNVGLLDQRKLLLWVQRHIAQFGGDPSHVVIFGASAGATSVFYHLSAYGGRNDNLFIGAIAESVWMHSQPPISDLEFQFDAFVNASGCSHAADQMACLRATSTTILEAADIGYAFPGQSVPATYEYGPVIDGTFLRQPLLEAFRQGKFLHLPMIIGSTTDEGSQFAPNAMFESNITAFYLHNYETLSPADAASIPRMYPKGPATLNHAAYFSAASAAYGESILICPAHTFSTFAAAWAPKPQIYHYHYAVQSTAYAAAGLGVPHAYEIPAVWGPDNVNKPDPAYASGGENAAVVPLVMDYWISFAQYLNPNTRRAAGAPVWNPLGNAVVWTALGVHTPEAMRLQRNGSAMEGWNAAQVLRCAYWEGLWGSMQF